MSEHAVRNAAKLMHAFKDEKKKLAGGSPKRYLLWCNPLPSDAKADGLRQVLVQYKAKEHGERTWLITSNVPAEKLDAAVAGFFEPDCDYYIVELAGGSKVLGKIGRAKA